MKNKKMLSFISLFLLVLQISLPAFALEENDSYTISSYIADLGLTASDGDISLCMVNYWTNSKSGSLNAYNQAVSQEEYAVLCRVNNADGTTTDHVFFSVYMDELTGELKPVIDDAVAESISGECIDVLRSDVELCTSSAIEYATTYTFYLDATYTSIDMRSEMTGGWAYHPVSSSFRITKSVSSAPSLYDVDFITAIASNYTVDTTTHELGEYNLYPFGRTYTSSSPIFNRTYSFDDYTYYVNYDDGIYLGQHLLVFSGGGSYFIKIENDSLSVVYDIHNNSSYCEEY